MSVTINGNGNIVLQVVQGILTTAVSTASGTFVDTGLTVTITPQSTSSKILVLTQMSSGGANGNFLMYQLVRNSTNIYSGTASVTYIASQVIYLATGNEGSSSVAGCINYLDSPATTSATIYKLQFKTHAGGTGYLNTRSSADITEASSITVLEISGA